MSTQKGINQLAEFQPIRASQSLKIRFISEMMIDLNQ